MILTVDHARTFEGRTGFDVSFEGYCIQGVTWDSVRTLNRELTQRLQREGKAGAVRHFVSRMITRVVNS